MASITISPNCDTRETVIKRDGTGVTTDSACKATTRGQAPSARSSRTTSPAPSSSRYWDLTLDGTEKAAVEEMLDTDC